MLQIFGSLFMNVADYSKTVGHVYCKPFKGLRAASRLMAKRCHGTQPERGVVIDAPSRLPFALALKRPERFTASIFAFKPLA